MPPLLQALQGCLGVGVDNYRVLQSVLGMTQGAQDAHQLSLEGRAVV